MARERRGRKNEFSSVRFWILDRKVVSFCLAPFFLKWPKLHNFDICFFLSEGPFPKAFKVFHLPSSSVYFVTWFRQLGIFCVCGFRSNSRSWVCVQSFLLLINIGLLQHWFLVVVGLMGANKISLPSIISTKIASLNKLDKLPARRPEDY